MPASAVRDLLAAGHTRGALHRAIDALKAVTAGLRDADPPRGMLTDAQLAGALEEITATLATRQPLRPPGYVGGPPSAADLTSVYDTAREQTARQR